MVINRVIRRSVYRKVEHDRDRFVKVQFGGMIFRKEEIFRGVTRRIVSTRSYVIHFLLLNL